MKTASRASAASKQDAAGRRPAARRKRPGDGARPITERPDMKSMIYHHSLSPAEAPAAPAFAEFAAAVGRQVRRAGAAVARGVHAMQTARLASVLSNMSDEQLAMIGIERSGVGAHVARIMADEPEYDGL